MPRITKIERESFGSRDFLRVFVDGECAGELAVYEGQGDWLELILRSGQAHEDMRELIGSDDDTPALMERLRVHLARVPPPLVERAGHEDMPREELERLLPRVLERDHETPAPPSDALEAYERTKRAGEGD